MGGSKCFPSYRLSKDENRNPLCRNAHSRGQTAMMSAFILTTAQMTFPWWMDSTLTTKVAVSLIFQQILWMLRGQRKCKRCSDMLRLCLQILFFSRIDEHKHEGAMRSVSAHLQVRLQAFSTGGSTCLCKAE